MSIKNKLSATRFASRGKYNMQTTNNIQPTLCFTKENLDTLLTNLYMTQCEVIFCEERGHEVVQMERGREILVEDAFEEIGKRFNAEVVDYNVMELGNMGEVFTFAMSA